MNLAITTAIEQSLHSAGYRDSSATYKTITDAATDMPVTCFYVYSMGQKSGGWSLATAVVWVSADQAANWDAVATADYVTQQALTNYTSQRVSPINGEN